MKKEQKVAIDLIWVKPGVSGGVESYIRNLLDGFALAADKCVKFVLFTSRDNCDSFEHYADKFDIVICEVNSSSASKRNIWANIHLGREIKKRNIKVCFEPVYSMPITGTKGIKFITTIHDLNQLHFPNNYGVLEKVFTHLSWKNVLKRADKVISVSQYVKDDILTNFKIENEKIVPILNPIRIDKDDVYDITYIKNEYGLNKGEYYYTVSSMLPHKNLLTIVRAMKMVIDSKSDLPHKLVISGVGGSGRKELSELIETLNIKGNVIVTPFISNTERNTLYKNCYAFVFPSVFEGFGMPPIEAMYFNVPVITTKETSIPEVTENKAIYVDNPFDPQEWYEKMNSPKVSYGDFDYGKYSYNQVSLKYLEQIKNILL